MKRIFIFFTMALALLVTPAQAKAVYCSNCSTSLLQALDRATNLEQLSNIVKQYHEAVTQTQQQIRMVQQNIEQYANMVQNTIQLPAHLVGEIRGDMTRLANLSAQLLTQRGDIVGLGKIFMNLFPEQALFGELAGASPKQAAEVNARYEAEWNKWAANVDQATQATFQLSGQQLQELQSVSYRLESYIGNLLSTPEGQQQALMAGNQLAALQIREARQLRELMATQAQSALAAQMKREKESQMTQEAWRDATKVDGLQSLDSKPDPF
jgi:P-type conjugative transfer protein TrbJ